MMEGFLCLFIMLGMAHLTRLALQSGEAGFLVFGVATGLIAFVSGLFAFWKLA